jgi:hypothetical protein
MGSLIEELERREAAARVEADRLRSRIEELAEDLARPRGRSRGWRSRGRKSPGCWRILPVRACPGSRARLRGDPGRPRLSGR